MLQIIIFSFNRAIQLDALLTSYRQFWKNSRTKVDVIYNTSKEEFQKGYDILVSKWSSGEILFHKESSSNEGYSLAERINISNFAHLRHYPKLRHPQTDFRRLMIRLMEQNQSNEVMFMTDDAIFIEEVDITPEILMWIRESPRHNQFSLRLGAGMNQQPENVSQSVDYMNWDFYKSPQKSNWGYHFSVDAHIYDKKSILYLYKKYIFTNPNSLEGYICQRIRARHWMGNGRCFITPKLLSYPINMVQDFNVNESMNCSPESMNDYFLKGYTLEYPIPEKVDTFQQYPSYITLKCGENIVDLKTNK